MELIQLVPPDTVGPASVLLLASYLYGSLPVVYLLGRWRGLDLKRVGSRNVGGTNLWQRAGAAWGLLGGLADASKGVLPVVVGRALGLELPWVVVAGLFGVAGQMWPVFLKFSGGRGVAAGMGFAFTVGLWQAMISASLMVLAAILWGVPYLRSKRLAFSQRFAFVRSQTHLVPVCMLASFASVPLLTWALGREDAVVLGCLGLLVLIVVRRVTADLPADLARGPRLGRRLWHRLLFDRSADEAPRDTAG